ncbi:hypothetical protein ISREJYDI_CDS0045 [Pseudomonas phage UNO-G1W1]|uniref:Uncharacterized protein n=1 Tax=Pseudomonas phage UNO-G1W1 TaxID=3136609 RepID=A0AAX4MVE6_9CAUD
MIELYAGWGLTVGCFIGIVALPKYYIPTLVVGMVVGALLLQGI